MAAPSYCYLSKKRRCLAPSTTILDHSHFRKASSGRNEHHRPTSPNQSDLSPGSLRAQPRPRLSGSRAPSPSPMRPPPPPLAPARPIRQNRHPPRRPYDTPPTPPPDMDALPPPPPRQIRHQGERQCKDKSTPLSNVTAFSNRPEFQVSRTRLLDNLHALRRFHPCYSSIEIDHEALASLPENGSVFDLLRSTTTRNTTIGTDIPEFVDEGREDIVLEGIVPNVGSGLREVDETRAMLEEMDEATRLAMTAPPLRPTPLYEHDKTSQHLINAFPFLFPQGLADLHATRQNKVSPNDYFKHLMKYEDGRFAAHPRFRYYAFNALLRWQARALAGYYVTTPGIRLHRACTSSSPNGQHIEGDPTILGCQKPRA
ncbi:hypothetical protein M231_01481 [Tremella mesenterica]|uniref:DUF6570 domain-containing protein n=1 Tax=Tremella mesenterica TaxID=5217 RepID=A0A4Q1BTD5_TREME|nr:hypothetical protein M231_01481 [Tremella mesenterica]